MALIIVTACSISLQESVLEKNWINMFRGVGDISEKSSDKTGPSSIHHYYLTIVKMKL